MGRNAEAGYFYCVMEVADDIAAGPTIEPSNYRPRTLAAHLAKRGRLPLEECLDLGVALAAALGHLHSRGLVHRDIKPANIIFVNAVPKLADIGLVTQIGSQATFVGTDGYIPPEGPGSPLADLIPILTASSVHTELMAYALEIAHQASRRPGGLPRMVPVRLQLPDELPRQIRFALDGASPAMMDNCTNPD